MAVHAKELVLLPADRYLSPPVRKGDRLYFDPLPGKDLTTDALAKALVGRDIARVSAEDGKLVATLLTGSPISEPNSFWLDIGPFKQTEYVPQQKLTLRRRSGTGIAAIELVNVRSEDEEWRRFLAREIDLVPSVRSSFVRYLAEVPTVRLVDVKQALSIGIIFHVDSGPLADVRLRRAISLGLRRHAIARVAVGSGERAANVPEDTDDARRLVAEIQREGGRLRPLRLAVPDLFSEAGRAALVIDQQLSEVGLPVAVETLDIGSVNDRIARRDFAMVLIFAGYQPFYYGRVLTNDPSNFGGYSNVAFDQAAATGDHRRALEILEEDVPMTPLYTATDAVALDKRFCGARPIVAADLTWLANVHMCAEGESQ